MKLTGPAAANSRPACAAAGRQGPPRRRGGRHGGGRTSAGARRRGSVEVTTRSCPSSTIPGSDAPGAPAIWAEVPDNVLVDTLFGDRDGHRTGVCRADHVVRIEFHIGRVTAAPMEPRAAVAQYDRSGRYTLYAGGGGAVRQKRELAAVLGIAPESCASSPMTSAAISAPAIACTWSSAWCCGRRARSGGRSNTRPAGPRPFSATIRAATSRPKWSSRYARTGVSSPCARQHQQCRRALRVAVPLCKGAGLIPALTTSRPRPARAAVFTNTMPTNAYRSSGRPEVTFAIERLIDTAADELGIDRIALRRKNLMIRGDALHQRGRQLTTAANTKPTWTRHAHRRLGGLERAAARPRRAASCSASGSPITSSPRSARRASGRIVTPEGRVDVVIGTQPSGQGHETSFAQVVSDLLRASGYREDHHG